MREDHPNTTEGLMSVRGIFKFMKSWVPVQAEYGNDETLIPSDKEHTPNSRDISYGFPGISFFPVFSFLLMVGRACSHNSR